MEYTIYYYYYYCIKLDFRYLTLCIDNQLVVKKIKDLKTLNRD